MKKMSSKKLSFKKLLKNERGDIGIKQIAITVAIIVILGLVIGALRTNMPTFVTDVWKMLMEKIDAIA
jgi:hypothetical protein